MEIVLVLLYFLLCSAWMLKGSFWEISRINRKTLVAIFAAKVILGIGYGLTYYQYYQTGDITHYFSDSKLIYSTLPENPGHYLQLTLGYTPSGQAPDYLSYIYDEMRISWRTREYTPVRINALFNLLSFGHYYVNVVFMALLSLIGLVLLHETFYRIFPHHRRLLIWGIFLVPSTLFWCSGVHKDGITLLAVSAMLYAVSKNLETQTLSSWILALAAAFLLWNTRAYSLLLLIPNLAVYWWCEKKPGATWLRFTSINLLLLLIMGNLHLVIPQLNLLAKLQFEQDFLLNLKGNTHLPMRDIGASVGQLISNIPMALEHIFLSPVIHAPSNTFQWIAAADNLIQLILFGWILSKFSLNQARTAALPATCLFFGIALLLLIGLTVPALGAIVRYKSVALPFLFASLIALTDPEKWSDKLRGL